MAGTDMAPHFVLRDGESPGWKRATRPPNINVPKRRVSRTDDSDADSDSSADEASSPARMARKKRTTTRPKPRQIGLPQLPGDSIETVVEILSDSSDSSGPDSPDSPSTPSLPPLPPPAAPSTTQVIEASPLPQLPPPVFFPSPSPSPPPPPPPPPASTPELIQTPPPAAPILPSPTPQPVRNGPVTLTPIAPPPRITRVPPPAQDNTPIRLPNLPVNEVNPEVPPVAAPVLPSFASSVSQGFPQITTSPDGIPDLFPTSTRSSTTTELALAPPPRKEVDSPSFAPPLPDTTTSTSTTTTRATPQVTAVPVEGNVTDSNRSRMDADTEHALIAVGSIGSFIFACFISFVIWYCIRRAKNKRKERQSQISAQDLQPQQSSNEPGFLAKVPFFNRFAKDRAWQNLDDGQPQSQYYEKTDPRGTLQLDTGFYVTNQRALSQQQPILITQGLPQVSFHSSPITVSPTATMLVRSNTVAAQHGTYQPTENGTLSNILVQYASSPTGDAVGQMNYNQVVMHSDGQPRRNANRTSEISSLSSGFGDGDIVVPPAAMAQRPAQNSGSRESWVSRGNRETIYTETSEDSPPRFRTVNSWVNQQTGRVKRQQARGADDVPPVPGLPGSVAAGMPPEPQFTMMMPDGEEPRRPDGYNNAGVRN